MKVVCISDCHGLLPSIPACDLLLIGGDLCPHAPARRVMEGERLISVSKPHVGSADDIAFQAEWLGTTFRSWLDEIPATHVAATWGNHDWIGQRRPDLVPKMRWELLVDRAVEILGRRIWGSPWQNWFYDWAFNAPEGPEGDIFLAKKYAAIPSDVSIVISHGPPKRYGDRASDGRHTGSVALDAFLQRQRTELLVTGHIHEAYGQYRHPSGCQIVNASILDEDYEPVNNPVEIDLD